ncbi:phosphoribosylamine--glycine ligase [Megalodesulfovibrio gigas]|uniref:Phosphoribosylamine--glycine ligase n=1 Tax=Megalodesulfovibrio gigas (strain ATCC 19364 / DSM 1382 / NCIMB 9332 / VKM B-1759) TaxID=1121448 RepID=T2G8V0_MEGG1|nr:phosphoribosylamine--glycine ligase [Megalodesulfovibrio gigas]AGW12584.1 putative phosphoribosylamine/glycine ligase [Megalodesulfovibrio gigas DSM 1382 = ATCC 19364]
MRCLIVGGGGREHALAWKMAQSPAVESLLIAPGNGGTAAMAAASAGRVQNVPVKDGDIPGLMALVARERIDLVVAGPELPLTLGLADACAAAGVPCFGPVQAAARLEGSKIFAKEAMVDAGVPTAGFAVFDDADAARAHVLAHSVPMVIKADGLAAGKGVVVAKTHEEALEAVDAMLVQHCFGEAGARVLIEDALAGEEASLLALCDGEHVVPLPACQDHKAIYDGDTGPNTGGMGAYSPAPILPDASLQAMCDLAITPIVRLMAQRGTPFKGVLYAGLMFVDGQPFVLEYNVRFGDPECQPLMTRLDCDLPAVLLACCEGRLAPDMLAIRPESALCLVLAAGGYPGSYDTGKAIAGLDAAGTVPGVTVFHAGTRLEHGQVQTSGGRVLGVTALGADLAQARDQAYTAAAHIEFDGKYCRSDIGMKGLRRLGLA